MNPVFSRACAVFAAILIPVAAVAADRPPPPERAPDGPGAPHFQMAGARPGNTELRAAPGANPPVDAEGDWLVGPDYVPAPETKAVAGVPQGRVIQFTMQSADSKFYPGVARDVFGTVDPANPRTLIVVTHSQPYQRVVTVFVPAQYQAGAAAPFIVSHDGPGLGKSDPTLEHTLDNLIAQGRVPALVAILIGNGGGDAQGSERGLEYDTLSGKFAEFIEAEVLPAVEQHAGVKLTHDPDGRAAMGGSSGGAAAFTMAWYHPEWYHRVVAYSGTFVNQQWPFHPETPDGAWDYHAHLIPENPPRPIRLWMHVSDQDLYNPNVMRDGLHDWVEANHHMAAALKAKGYHYQYVFSLNSFHVDHNVREQTLPEALEWVWKGYVPKG
ncbi:MAG TPA: alpha/beta hydrolase-fold protein [Candidatus Didemnitutus sp.]|nr:alpha/beta hydrolase-fold protein [Candidatus Didemnitutus sp.]